ncbi:MAG: ATP-binding protein [Dysgonamonadaceae bacterium]
MAKLDRKIELRNTRDLQSVFRQCEMTQAHRLMTGLTADTGMGKTTSLKAYANQGKNVFLVTVDKTMNAKRLFLKIGDLLGIGFDGNIHDVMLRVSSRLNELDSPLLVIDEAGKLNHIMMLYLHDLREYTKDNCGILLAGMPYFKARLERFSERQKEGCSEFLRRINVWHELSGLSRKEVEYVCREEDVKDDLQGYYGLRFGDLMNRILLNKITNEKL